jgi:hypothetical protein
MQSESTNRKEISLLQKYKNSRFFFEWKSQMSTMDYKEEAKIWMKKPKLDENRIKIGEIFILHP